jgi:hypothetical protein
LITEVLAFIGFGLALGFITGYEAAQFRARRHAERQRRLWIAAQKLHSNNEGMSRLRHPAGRGR